MDRISRHEYISFRQFQFIPEIYPVLDTLNITSPTSIQSVVIPKILEQKHTLFASAPGLGKTLAYLLPLLNKLKMEEKQAGKTLTMLKRPRGLILVPTRELAQQVEEVAKLFVYDVPLKIESYYVGKSFLKEKNIQNMDILISTPERFKNHWSKGHIYTTMLEQIVVDELDTLLDGGHAELLKEIIGRNIGRSQFLFATTTLTPILDSFIIDLFGNEITKIIDKSTNHNLSHIKHEFIHVTDYDKFPTLLRILKDNKAILNTNSIIIFANSVNCCRKLEFFLTECGFVTASIHGEIPPLRRREELLKFKRKKAKILICTDIVARGLDFPFVSLVINFDFPKAMSDYLHRAGRTGRAFQKGLVCSLYRKDDQSAVNQIQDCNRNQLPLKIDSSIFSLKNKELLVDKRKALKSPLSENSIEMLKPKTMERKEIEHIRKVRHRKEILTKYKQKMEWDRKRSLVDVRTRLKRKKHNLVKKKRLNKLRGSAKKQR